MTISAPVDIAEIKARIYDAFEQGYDDKEQVYEDLAECYYEEFTKEEANHLEVSKSSLMQLILKI